MISAGTSLGGLTIGAACVDLTLAEHMRSPEYATSRLNDTGAALIGNPVELGVVRLNWRTADPDLLATLKDALLATPRLFAKSTHPAHALNENRPWEPGLPVFRLWRDGARRLVLKGAVGLPGLPDSHHPG